MLYKLFVAWNCNGCSIAPLTDDVNNLIYLKFSGKNDYFTKLDKMGMG